MKKLKSPILSFVMHNLKLLFQTGFLCKVNKIPVFEAFQYSIFTFLYIEAMQCKCVKQ